MRRIAVIMVCHNRCAHTLACLRALFSQVDRSEAEKSDTEGKREIEVFLVDDGSSDGTSVAVKEQFPEATIIKGTGNLFWAKGMNLAWRVAAESGKAYDGYLWLNDDVVLKSGAIEKALEEWRGIGEESAVLVGACSSDESERECSYGITDEHNQLVPPNGKVTRCKGWFTGNFVFVPRKAYEKVGMISGEYTHARADYDYAERLKRAGIAVYGTSGYVGVCVNDFDKKMRGKSLWARIRMLWTPGYYNLHDMFIFRMKYYGFARALVSCAHLTVLAIRGVK